VTYSALVCLLLLGFLPLPRLVFLRLSDKALDLTDLLRLLLLPLAVLRTVHHPSCVSLFFLGKHLANVMLVG